MEETRITHGAEITREQSTSVNLGVANSKSSTRSSGGIKLGIKAAIGVGIEADVTVHSNPFKGSASPPKPRYGNVADNTRKKPIDKVIYR